MPPAAEGLASRFLGPALRTQSDRRLVTLVRDGYESAFEEIVRRYGRPLTRYAAAIVGGHSEDVTQDAFSKALLALRRDDAEVELRPWLYRIVRNTALNDLRDSPPSPEVLAEAIAGGRTPAEELERREELADLIRRLQALPEPQRAAIVMRELGGLGHEEIAAALGLSGGAARQAIYRAREALRAGAGMLLPLPLLRALLEGGGPGSVEAAAGAAGVGGAAGAGLALKATAATVLVAGAVGAGVALDHSARPGRAEAISPPSRSGLAGAAAAPAGAPSDGERLVDRGGNRGSGGVEGDRRGGPNGGEGSSGPSRDGSGGGSSGPGPSQTGSPHNGPGSGKGADDGGSPTAGGDDSGSSARSGPDSGSGSGDDPQAGEAAMSDDFSSSSGPGSGGDDIEGSSSGPGGGSAGSNDSGGSSNSGSSSDSGGSSGSGSGSGDSSRDSSGGDGLTD